MRELSLDLRRRIVDAYESGVSGTYVRTAQMFGVGEATVNRLLRRQRETGDVHAKPHASNNPRRVQLDWLREHLRAHPDARLVDRVEAWRLHSGKEVSVAAMHKAVHACGWTHKKRRIWRASATART